MAQRPAKVALKDRQTAVGRGRFAAVVLRSKVMLQLLLRTAGQRLALQMGLQLDQIPPVGLQAVERQAVLQPKRIDKCVNGGITRRCRHGARWQAGQTYSSLSLAVSTTCL